MSHRLNASITVEASFSFTLLIFILFLCLSPLLIIKTSSDIMIKMNEANTYRCDYELMNKELSDTHIYNKIKEKIDDKDKLLDKIDKILNVMTYEGIIFDVNRSYDSSKSEYKSINSIYDFNTEVYDDDTGIVKYDFEVEFNLPYNLLHINNIKKRFVNVRRAFTGAPDDRFSKGISAGDYVYVANNYKKSHVYHEFIDCTRLVKKTESMDYREVGNRRNDNNEKYSKCSYCFKNIKLDNDTICFITTYGDLFHYKENCPLMTAYVTKISNEKVAELGLRLCLICEGRKK